MRLVSTFVLAASLTVAAMPAFAFTATAPVAFRAQSGTPQAVAAHSRPRRHHCSGTHNGNCRLYHRNF